MNRKWIKWGALAAVATAGLVFLDAWLFEQYFFQINKFDIGDKDDKNKVKILLLTDLHFGSRLWPYQRKLAKTINELKPDILLIAGDIIDQFGDWQPAEHFFSMLDRDLPKAAIPGNHDHKNNVSIHTLDRICKKHNCNLLRNESQVFLVRGKRIVVSGIDDFIESNGSLEDAVKDIGHEERHILLVHSPLQQEEVKTHIDLINSSRPAADRLHISYIFAGHNHGGQVRLPGIVPVLPKKSGEYIDGWYNDAPPYLYVSRGFGTSAVPFRFFARSEVDIFNYG